VRPAADRSRIGDGGAPHPRCTYRLQLHGDFSLHDAAELTDYLAALGVSHVYTSPILQAEAGSSHGYDAIDPTRIDADRGGSEGGEHFWRALARHGLGHLLDIVPNHLSTATPGNRWWWSVLRRGSASSRAHFFDVDWEACAARGDGAIELPLLDRDLDAAIRDGVVRIGTRPGEPVLHVGDGCLPLDPGDRDLRDEEHRGDPRTLRALLEAQPYRLVHWRRSESHLDYRRFFDVHSLIGVRVEDPEVFRATHQRILEWVRAGKVQGLRVDHPDGLSNPAEYLRRLATTTENAWVVVEKILEPGERLRDSWSAAGTTGYDFLSSVGGLFVDPAGERELTRIYRQFTRDRESWEATVVRSKRSVLEALFRPELARLERALLRCASTGFRTAPPRRAELRAALAELLIRFPVYRSYVEFESGRVEPEDESVLAQAADSATRHRPDLARSLRFVLELLRLRAPAAKADAAEFVRRFQQTTGPLMAKGVEDTALYTFARFLALNEVGCNPSHFGTLPEQFHADCRRRQRDHPLGLLTTSTHDTKRSEDVRARLALLSEIPARWGAAVRRWRDHNEVHRRGDLPDRRLEYFLYQILVGAHPLPRERARSYVEKAIREARAHTSWTHPDPEYESAVRHFVEGLLEDEEFLCDLERFVAPLIPAGRTNSLAQTLLKLTAPGIPDVYQGTELWDLSLVDPDNRRPVDYARRRRLLRWTDTDPSPEDVLSRSETGAPKLWVTRQALHLRRRRPEAFGPESGYHALPAQGHHGHRVVAFARSAPRGVTAVTAVPRLALGAGGRWSDTTLHLPEGEWTNLLTHERGWRGAVALGDLWARFPVALLAAEERAGSPAPVHVHEGAT